MSTSAFAPGVQVAVAGTREIYTGTVDAVLAAGLVLAPQVPAEAGSCTRMRSYRADGSQACRGTASKYLNNPIRLRIVRRGPMVTIEKRLTEEELAARLWKELSWQRCWPFPVHYGSPP